MVEPLADFETRCASIRASLTGRHLAIYDETIKRVSPEAVLRFQTSHRERLANFPPESLEKYGDIPRFIADQTRTAVLFDLDQRQGLHILDIGSGGGFFLAIAETLGHKAIGIDIDEPFYADLCSVMGVDRRVYPVKPQQRLPNFGTRFNLITITLQKFDHLATHPDGSRDYWSIDDWSFFLSDLKVRQAKDDGTIYLELNTEKQKGIETYNPHLIALLRAVGRQD
jgi:hypothetical protein